MDSGLHVVDSGFQVLNSDSLSVVLGFRIPVVSGIPDSKARDSGFHKQKFSGFRIPDFLTWVDLSFIMEIVTLFTTILLTPATIAVYIKLFFFPFWSVFSVTLVKQGDFFIA